MSDPFMAIQPALNPEGRTPLEFSPLTDILLEHSDGNAIGTNTDPVLDLPLDSGG